MSEEIINALGRVPQLRVVSHTSSRRYKTRDVDARDIARELGVSWLLEGSVRRAEDTVRIAVQLVRATDGFTAWSGRFDRPIERVFVVQDEIAASIVQTLVGRVVGDTGPLVTSTTANAQAYSLYLEGRYLWNKRPGREVWRSLDYFERAVRIDPTFAPAHAAVAAAYGVLGGWEYGVISPPDALAKAKAAARRALQLDPRLAAAHAALAYAILHFDWNPESAGDELTQAIALSPGCGDAHHWYSHALCASGRFAESLVASQRAIDADPLNPLLHAHLAWHHYMARDFARGLEQSEQLLRIEPGFHWGHLFKGWALERLGRPEDAVAAFNDSRHCSPESPAMLAGLGHALASLGDRRAATRVADDLRSLRRDQKLYAYELAMIHGALRQRDLAFEWLSRAIEERSGWIVYLPVDPRLDDLRTDPRFAPILTAARG